MFVAITENYGHFDGSTEDLDEAILVVSEESLVKMVILVANRRF